MLGEIVQRPISLLTLLALAAAAQTIPAGTRLTVRVGSEISSGTAKAGDRFDATLAHPLVVNGKTLARTGAPVRGKVTSAKSSASARSRRTCPAPYFGTSQWQDASDRDWLSLGQGQGAYQEQCDKDRRRCRGGCPIGALAGGGKGAAIGAGVGAGAGTGVAVATGKEEAVVPVETALTFTTR